MVVWNLGKRTLIVDVNHVYKGCWEKIYVIRNWEIRFPEFLNKQILILLVVEMQLLHLSACSFVQVKGKLAPNMFQDNISTNIEKIYLE